MTRDGTKVIISGANPMPCMSRILAFLIASESVIGEWYIKNLERDRGTEVVIDCETEHLAILAMML
jgi:hypothetical protein